MVFFVELINVLALLTNTEVIDIVMDFLALVVISEFDDFFFNAIVNKDVTNVIEDKAYNQLLKWQITTSINARNIMEGNRLEPQPCEEEEYSKRIAEAEELEEKTRINDGIKDYKPKVRPLHNDDSD